MGKDFRGQDIAAARLLVAKDAVVEQVIGGAFVDAQQGRNCVAGKGKAGFDKPNMRGQGGEADSRRDVSGLVKDRNAQLVKAESTAAFPDHILRNAALFAFDDFLQARGAMRLGMVAHFDTDVTPPHFLRHGGGRAGT